LIKSQDKVKKNIREILSLEKYSLHRERKRGKRPQIENMNKSPMTMTMTSP
jgi:hypothetical protein